MVEDGSLKTQRAVVKGIHNPQISTSASETLTSTSPGQSEFSENSSRVDPLKEERSGSDALDISSVEVTAGHKRASTTRLTNAAQEQFKVVPSPGDEPFSLIRLPRRVEEAQPNQQHRESIGYQILSETGSIIFETKKANEPETLYALLKLDFLR
jgi:hypothetical protein